MCSRYVQENICDDLANIQFNYFIPMGKGQCRRDDDIITKKFNSYILLELLIRIN